MAPTISPADKKAIETLSQRIVRNIRDSRLVKLIHFLTHFSLTAQIKINGQPISSLLTFLILVFGIAFSVKLLYKYLAKPILYPILRALFFKIFRGHSNLLPRPKNLAKAVLSTQEPKWVLVYGATNHLGIQVAKVFASHGYCLLLIDSSLTKLQAVQQDLLQVFPHLVPEKHVRIVNLNLAIDPNSTVIEHRLHQALFGETTWRDDQLYEANDEAFQPDAPQPPPVQHARDTMKCLNLQVFVNCIGLDKDMLSTNQKLFHELQFDQLSLVLGKQALGFSLLLNYFSRVYSHFEQQSCVISFQRQVVMPWERHDRHLLLRLGRVFFFPITYHKQMDRIDIVQAALNRYSTTVLENMRLGYPLLQCFEIPVHMQDVADLKTKDVEQMLVRLKY